MRIQFFLKFHTVYGQSLSIKLSKGGDELQELPMEYYNEEYWQASMPWDGSAINYRYQFRDSKGVKLDAEKERKVEAGEGNIVLIDTWNDESFYENAFQTAPFSDVFFKKPRSNRKKPISTTHTFRIKAPLIQDGKTVVLSGSSPELGAWNLENPIPLQVEEGWWTLRLDLPLSSLPVSYKYGVVDGKTGKFETFESGDNRLLITTSPGARVILHDGFLRMQNNQWKGAGIAIPVFSLRSNNSFGVGEFTDIKLLADWAELAGIKLIQLLPVNDTSATYTWKDSYPYAAISAFALHPIYVNLEKVAGKSNTTVIKSIAKKQKQLNALPEVDYEQVMKFKMRLLHELFELDDMQFTKDPDYKAFYEENKSWLVPYAAFCFLRDRHGSADFSTWKTHSKYDAEEVGRLVSPRSRQYRAVSFFYFVQYHLHMQLGAATRYCHKKGIAVKGDIPIGIYRYGSDAWTAPELYHMDQQAGAPPDDFAVMGQNWGFPTYNWKKMEEDNFQWWRLRFQQMSNYFDAFRIDHILGFFRIWSIPLDYVQGTGGRFIPALPIYEGEFGERGIWFNKSRYCDPYINDEVLKSIFGAEAGFVKEHFLEESNNGYKLKEFINTQRKAEAYFDASEEEIKKGIYTLISNVILFEESTGKYHFRISMNTTSSFQHLDPGTRQKLMELYNDYFYRRQDEFWKEEALHKLPALKDATRMLVCGEDLGMVPHSVPEVMQQLGILSLEIQRMPKDPKTEFFHPKDAPYLSVITPSSHDMSTIRGWWEEDREKTQKFYNRVLVESGAAPYFCEAWINRAIILQHLYSPAMWSIFQIQDLLGMSEELRRENPAEERINEPSNPTHYWNYRMHITLEDLMEQTSFNGELRDYLKNSGRI